MKDNKEKRAILFIVLASAFWGTAGIFVRGLEHSVSQINMVLGRALLAAVIFASILLIKDKALFRVKLKDLPWFVASGVFSIIMFNYCYYKTMQLASLSVAAVLLYTAPFFVVAMSAIIFKERLTFKKILSCIVAFVGCVMVSGIFSGSANIGTTAIFFGVLTGLGYAFYTIFGEILLKKGYNSLTINFYVFLSAAVGCLLTTDIKDFVIQTTATPKIAITVFLMVVINTVLPYIFYTSALKNIETSKAPIIAIIEPVVATLIGTFIFREKITVVGIIGIILVLSAIVILNFKDGEKDEGNKLKG